MIIEVTRAQLQWLFTLSNQMWVGRAAHATEPAADRYCIGSSQDAVELWARQAAHELEVYPRRTL